MRINKDLVEALLMVSFICLVLIGTTVFENMVTKEIVMGAVGALTVVMAVLRVKAGRQSDEHISEYN